MFLPRLQETSPELIDYALYLHRRGQLLPDTFVIDIGIIEENAAGILAAAKEKGISLYYMLKQIGRNPLIAHRLDDMGYSGAVAVDFKETLGYLENHIRLGHVGNLVQIPSGLVSTVVAAKPRIITVFSPEKAGEINEAARALNMVQDIQLRVRAADGPCYPGQMAGFTPEELPGVVSAIEALPHVRLSGVCAFPAFLCDVEGKAAKPTENVEAVRQAAGYLRSRGHQIAQVNLSSAICTSTIPLAAEMGATVAEPGHGLTGTTPLHKNPGQRERVGYLYLTEVSHNVDGRANCYGGGRYPRGHLCRALCGSSADALTWVGASAVNADNIDYHFELHSTRPVGEAVIMCYRAQAFVSRSNVAVVDARRRQLLGIYDAYGVKKVR